MKKKILWVVTARSGSKSIPDKNIKLLGGHPLLSYRIKSCMLTTTPSDLWISTDSMQYATIAKSYGAQIPFIRPDDLSQDYALSAEVLIHAMDFANSISSEYEYIGLLEPTSPFVSAKDLDNAILELDRYKEATSIVAVKESRPNSVFIQKESTYLDKLAENLETLNRYDRQAFMKEITPSGGFYISRWESFLSTKTFYTSKTLAYELDDIASLEIDEPLDWVFAEFIIKQKLFDTSLLFKG